MAGIVEDENYAEEINQKDFLIDFANGDRVQNVSAASKQVLLSRRRKFGNILSRIRTAVFVFCLEYEGIWEFFRQKVNLQIYLF